MKKQEELSENQSQNTENILSNESEITIEKKETKENVVDSYEEIKIDLEKSPEEKEPSFGWSQYAEKMNGRFAMIGFLSVILIELLSNKSFLQWAGIIN
tara:strand:- start:31912 stop:32208 length:297 start_codon:yes stop_codon:yes gene_type:complete